MKRPLAALVPAFCLGIIFASWIHPAFGQPYYLYLSAALLVLSFLFLKSNKLFGVVIFCLAFSLGMAALANSDTTARDNLRNYILYKGAGKGPYIVKGSVLNNPVTQNGRTVFLFRVAEVQVNNLRHNCSGNILVRSAYPADWGYGQELVLCGNIYRNRFCRRQVCALMRIKSPSQAVILNRNKGAKLKAIAFWLKKKL